MSTVVLVKDTKGDWEALYVNQELVAEGHTLAAFMVLDALLGKTVDVFAEAEVDFSNYGKGPALLSEFDDLVYIRTSDKNEV
jgi:hypothetical protein